MRFVALALILISLPLFIALLKQHSNRRDLALVALGVMPFISGNLQIDAAVITWPLWSGAVRGIQISPVDTLAIALILTRTKGSNSLPFFGLLGFYASTLVLSLTAASVPMATVFSCIQFLRVTIFFIAIGGEFARPGAPTNLLVGLSLGLMLQAGYVITQKLSGVVQASGTMGHQNILGMMTELALLPLIAAVLDGNRRKLVYAGIVAGLIVIAGGGSRGAMALVTGGIVILTVLSLARRRSPRKLKIVGLGVMAMAAIIPLGLATLEDRFGDSSFTTEEEQRAAFERSARAMAADYPLGVGANLYVPVANMEGYADKAGVAWNFANRSAPVHNAYLLARAETGYAGEIAFFLLLAVPAVFGLRAAFAQRSDAGGAIALGSSVGLIAIIVHNFYEFAAHAYNPQALILLNIAVIAGHIRVSKLARQTNRSLRKPLVINPALAYTKSQGQPVTRLRNEFVERSIPLNPGK